VLFGVFRVLLLPPLPLFPDIGSIAIDYGGNGGSFGRIKGQGILLWVCNKEYVNFFEIISYVDELPKRYLCYNGN